MKITFDLLGVMEKYGLKQVDLAKAADLKPTTMSAFCKGNSYPSIKSLMSMAEKLDIPIQDFFKVDDDNIKNEGKYGYKCPHCHHPIDIMVSIVESEKDVENA